jgi:hypothetical protein
MPPWMTSAPPLREPPAGYAGGGIYNAGPAAALTVSGTSFSGNKPDNIFGPFVDGGGNTFG